MDDATREMTFWLAGPERRALRWLAARVPTRIRPNHLTAVGVLGAVGTGLGYALSGWHRAWLGLAIGMLALNWFGDSLDGTLARFRRIERPRYGYYLDHVIDAFNTVVVGLGIGLSPYLHVEIALLLVVVYLTLSINVYLESSVFGVFRIAYGRLGPTEARILLAGGTLALALGAPGLATLANVVGGGLVALMSGLFAFRVGHNLHRLARLEPQFPPSR